MKQTNKIGFILNHIGFSHLNLQVFSAINKLVHSGRGKGEKGVMVFFENVSPGITVNSCPIFPLHETWCFEGDLIATSFETAKKLMSIPISGQKVFHVFKIEHFNKALPYEELCGIFNNPKLQIQTHSRFLKEILEYQFGGQVKLVEELGI